MSFIMHEQGYTEGAILSFTQISEMGHMNSTRMSLFFSIKKGVWGDYLRYRYL